MLPALFVYSTSFVLWFCVIFPSFDFHEIFLIILLFFCMFSLSEIFLRFFLINRLLICFLRSSFPSFFRLQLHCKIFTFFFFPPFPFALLFVLLYSSANVQPLFCSQNTLHLFSFQINLDQLSPRNFLVVLNALRRNSLCSLCLTL